MLVANCYRPPSGKPNTFFDLLESSLDSILHLDEYEIYINGDLNIPYNHNTTADYFKIKHIEDKYQLTQLIDTPTRCTM